MSELTVRETQIRRQEDLITQMALIVAQLRTEVDELKRGQQAVTVSHADTLAVSRLIRQRAAELRGKYALSEAAEKKLRAEIKKAALTRYGIRDLHDLPARWLPACRALIAAWGSWDVVRRLRT